MRADTLISDRTNHRAIACFALLGGIALLLLGRVTQLQVGRAAANREEAERQRVRTEPLPSPRGTIVDRAGRLLAYDRPILEVRAEATARLDSARQHEDFQVFARGLAADLAFALAADSREEQAGQQEFHRRRLLERILACWKGADPAATSSPGRKRTVVRRIDFLVCSATDSAAVLERLDQVDRRRDYLYLHRLRRFERTYPGREATHGVVGFLGHRDLVGGGTAKIYRGMEAFSGLLPEAAGWRELWQDSVARRYWSESAQAPQPPVVLQSTLDLPLQRVAHEELLRAVDVVTAHYSSPPEWGALCLADLNTASVLAMASYRVGVHPKIAAFSPTQCVIPPGSVVKPLVFSLVLERGLADWDGETINCQYGRAGWPVPHVRRSIKDSSPHGILTPREILVQSSNIGAVKVGLRLGREGLEEYLRRFGFGRETATHLPGERAGSRPDNLQSMPERNFWGYTAPSLCFGYEYGATPIQLLRAYVTLLSGRTRELRLFSRIAADGGLQNVDVPDSGEAFLSPATLHKLRDAMRGVVSHEPSATGSFLCRELERRGVGPGVIAGKTGTSEYREKRAVEGGGTATVWVRTASFAGFAPADRPRFVAVCVIQKPEAHHFWGGRYAAPAVGGLLLAALAQRSPQAGDPQVSVAFPGSSSSGGQPAVGR